MTDQNETPETRVSLKQLYKIFGDDPETAMEHVRNGLSKADLLDQHNHVLGLNDINIDIPDGKMTVIMGLSGSGKSTLIRHLNLLIRPTDGEIEVDGENILNYSEAQLRTLRQQKMSMVFQKFGLLPHRTVLENAGMPLAGDALEEDRGATELDAELRHVRLVDQDVFALQVEPVVEPDLQLAVFHLQHELVIPVQGLAHSTALCFPDDVVGLADIGVLGCLGDLPDPLIGLAVGIQKVLDQSQRLAVPSTFDIDREFTPEIAEAIFKNSPGLGLSEKIFLKLQLRGGALEIFYFHGTACSQHRQKYKYIRKTTYHGSHPSWLFGLNTRDPSP